MTDGQIYRCQNRDCGCEIRVIRRSMEANSNPRCCCGTEMKKLYQKPVLRALPSDIDVFMSPQTNRNRN